MLNKYQIGVFLILQFLFTNSCNNSNTNIKIYGKWEGNYKEHELSIIFNSDSSCVMTFFNEQSSNAETINGKFEIDYSKLPVSLSITNISELKYSLHTIIEFQDYNSIRMAEFSTKWRLRPISFKIDKTIHLKRLS